MERLGSSAALAILLAAAPAAAQYAPRQAYGFGDFRGGGIEGEIVHIQERIHIAAERRLISPREAERLYREADHILDRLRHKAEAGLSARDRENLQRRVNALRDHLRLERWGDRHRDW
jgi:hypothetical protein